MLPSSASRTESKLHDSLDDGVILCSGGYDSVIKVWSAYSGTCLQRSLVHSDSHVNCLLITPERSYFVAGGYQSVRLYDINSQNRNPTITFDGLNKNITSVGSNDAFTFMFTTGEDGYARILDPKGDNQRQRKFEAKAPLNSARLHPNQTSIFMVDQQGSLYMWDLRKDQNESIVLNKDCSIQCVDIDETGEHCVAIDNKGTMYFMRMDETTGGRTPFFFGFNICIRIKAHSRYGLKCRFTPDGKRVVTSSADKTAKVWDVEKLKEGFGDDSFVEGIHEFDFRDRNVEPEMVLTRESQRWVWDLAFTMDSQNVFTASSDNMVRLWNLKTGDVEREYSGHSKAVIALAFLDTPQRAE